MYRFQRAFGTIKSPFVVSPCWFFTCLQVQKAKTSAVVQPRSKKSWDLAVGKALRRSGKMDQQKNRCKIGSFPYFSRDGFALLFAHPPVVLDQEWPTWNVMRRSSGWALTWFPFRVWAAVILCPFYPGGCLVFPLGGASGGSRKSHSKEGQAFTEPAGI